MKKRLIHKILIIAQIFGLNLMTTGKVFATSSDTSNLSVNSKVLTTNRAIATWPTGIPVSEERPVIVFLPGWGGVGAVNASISSQNTNLVNQGYVTLAIGFDSNSTWISDIEVKTLQGLDKLCTDTTIPANCNAIILVGSSYGGAQNYWVMEHLRSNGYGGGPGSKGKALGFLSEDAGYGAPGVLTNSNTGAFNRTGLANTSSYSVAMIENLGDTTFPVDECTWGNCGARELSNAHFANGDDNVFSICPVGGEHGTRGFSNWNAWVISAIKTMIHTTSGIPTFSGYTIPAMTVGNTCADTNVIPLSGLSVSGINIVSNNQPVRLRGINMGDPFWARGWYGTTYSTNDYSIIAQEWGANVVRISIFPTQWKNMNRTALLAGLSQEINAALNNGMYVIISYHVIGWPNGFYQSACCGNPADTYDSNLSTATSFWTQMAQTYGSDTRIIFDLWNEPVHPDDFTLYGSTPNPLWAELKLAYESLIQAVRTNGGQNIVVATGNRWGSWLVGIKENPLSDPNVIYAYHKYSVEGSNTTVEWNKDTGGLIGIRPVIVSEWGYEDIDIPGDRTWPGSQTSYAEPFTEWMESNNLSNLAWMYHHEWNPALLKSGGGLTYYGTFVKNYIFENNHLPHYILSGSTGLPGTTLSYTDGTLKTVISQSDGSYSINVPAGWSGTVTPSHACYIFSPTSFSYNDVNSDQTDQNHAFTINPACKEVDVTISNLPKGAYLMSGGQSSVQSYNSTNGGPVVIESTDGSNIIASLLQFRRPGTSGEWTDITQTMALTDAQISDAYVFPRYDFSDPKKYNSIQLANFDSISTTVNISVGGVLRGSYPLSAGSSQNVTFSGVIGGPVVVSSNNGAEIIASLYELKRTSNTGLYTGQTQMMGLPQAQLSDTYIIPRYNYTLQDVIPYVVFANAGNQATQVTVTIGGVLRGTYNLAAGQSTIQSYGGVNGGPVVIQSNNGTHIIASLLQFRRPGSSGEWTGITQTMALTDSQISDVYLFPHYDFSNPKKYNSIQLANFDSIATDISVTIGGVLRGTYPLAAGSSQNITFPGLTAGPVVIKSNNGADIIASLYELKRTTDTGLYSGQTQMMGLPETELSGTYIIPRYNYTLQDVIPYIIFSMP